MLPRHPGREILFSGSEHDRYLSLRLFPRFLREGIQTAYPGMCLVPGQCASLPSLGFREKMFTRYTLEVEHDPDLVAISQGKADRGIAGMTRFSFDHNMPGISLCIGNYKRREMLFAETR